MSVEQADISDPPALVRRWRRYGRGRPTQVDYSPRHAAADGDSPAPPEQGVGVPDTARRLAKLGPDWKVLHAIPVGTRGSTVDHVLIGPGGVFTVNAMHHPQASVRVGHDTVTVNGDEQPYVGDSRHEAARAAALLSAATAVRVDVQGIVVVVGADRNLTVEEQPGDGLVTVVGGKRLLAHLRELPEQLDTDAIERIHDAAQQVATWRASTPPSR